MAITHICMFKFVEGTSEEAKQDLIGAFMALKENCINTLTGKPYISSIKGGKNISIENHGGGWSHAFVLEFPTEEDRDYYVKHEKALKDLEGVCKGVMGDHILFDLEDGDC